MEGCRTVLAQGADGDKKASVSSYSAVPMLCVLLEGASLDSYWNEHGVSPVGSE